MTKRYITGGPYRVYHHPTGKEYFFEWRPTKADLKKLCNLKNISLTFDNSLKPVYSLEDFIISTIKYQKPSLYGLKLRFL